MGETDKDRADRLAAALRANLRRRKGQKSREDLSGLDPKRQDTPLHRVSETPPESGPGTTDKT